MKIKVDLISGFLGAGKTTLIKKILLEKLQQEKIVLIENEFGQVGIDGLLLGTDVRVKEINSGCICCTLVGDFISALEELASWQPERIIIEPSGVAKLTDIIRACQSLDNLVQINQVITVVDIFKYELFLRNFGEFYEDQLRQARTIILSRTQLARPEQINQGVTVLQGLNKEARIITAPWETITAEELMKAGESQENCFKQGLQTQQHSHSAPDTFEVWSRETIKRYSPEVIRSILQEVGQKGQYGFVVRGKGILQDNGGQWFRFDYLPGEITINSSSPQGMGKISFIGHQLDREKLSQLLGLIN